MPIGRATNTRRFRIQCLPLVHWYIAAYTGPDPFPRSKNGGWSRIAHREKDREPRRVAGHCTWEERGGIPNSGEIRAALRGVVVLLLHPENCRREQPAARVERGVLPERAQPRTGARGVRGLACSPRGVLRKSLRSPHRWSVESAPARTATSCVHRPRRCMHATLHCIPAQYGLYRTCQRSDNA